LRRQPGPRQLLARRLRRRAAEVPLRPEVHRFRRPLQGQRHRRDRRQRPEHLPEGPRLRQPHLQDHLLRIAAMHSRFHRLSALVVAVGAAFAAPFAVAGVTAEEAKALGTTLTAVGAEKAGNKEGTIPAYTGGLT